jgi:signal transduction histidine kinase
MPVPTPMRLSAFIAQNKEPILQDWENFAQTIEPPALTMDRKALRDHAGLLLDTIIADLDTAQSPAEQSQKSWGKAPQANAQIYAQAHAADRLKAGYTINQLVSEYRALRASVLRLWAGSSRTLMLTDPDDVTRFNEAVDQALAESVIRYSQLVESRIHKHKQAEDELRQSNHQKDEFLAMLAHELRNPLAPIITAAHLLSLPAGNETRIRKASAIIIRQVRHMTELVDDLLDVSRVTRGLVELRTETLDVRQIVSSALEQVQPLIEAHGQTLELHLGSAPTWVVGDKTRLIQVLSNLLNNAAKYTPQSGKIVLSLEVQGDQVRLTVSDNGSGMAPSLVPHVFELFTQAERSSDRTQGGLGLGLALVNNIIALHGGKVEASSEGLGKGSVFSVTLPRVKGQAQTASNPGEPKPAEQAARHDPLRLMIVDDNRDAAEMIAGLLEARSHKALVHESAENALADARLPGTHVLILDIGLPGMDGYALASQLRARAQTQGAVLVALTGYGQAHDRALSKAAGFDHFFVKPMHMHQLTELLAKLKA